MLKVGLTGGIGSGKSTVAQVFEVLGVPVYYADDATKRLYHSDPELIASMKLHFGEDIYQDNQLNRARLASIVFSDPEKLKLLNSISHPPTIRDAVNWMNAQTSPYIIKEAALIFESGSNKDLDLVIGVSAPEELRIRRVMERENIAETEVRKRMERQMDEDEKMKRCDFVLLNNEVTALLPQVLELHAELVSRGDAEKKRTRS